MKRRILTHHTVRCPLEEGRAASVTVRTDRSAAPSRRYRRVMACSLLPSTSFVPSPRSDFFADPPVGYLCEVESAPCHVAEIACTEACLEILNAAEAGAAEPVRCTSGVSDALELARQTQSPGMMRVLWLNGV